MWNAKDREKEEAKEFKLRSVQFSAATHHSEELPVYFWFTAALLYLTFGKGGNDCT